MKLFMVNISICYNIFPFPGSRITDHVYSIRSHLSLTTATGVRDATWSKNSLPYTDFSHKVLLGTWSERHRVYYQLAEDTWGHDTKQGLANCSPQAKCGLPPGFMNKILLEHTIYTLVFILSMATFRLQLLSWVVGTKIIWPKFKNIYYLTLYTKCLLTSDVELGLGALLQHIQDF